MTGKKHRFWLACRRQHLLALLPAHLSVAAVGLWECRSTRQQAWVLLPVFLCTLYHCLILTTPLTPSLSTHSLTPSLFHLPMCPSMNCASIMIHQGLPIELMGSDSATSATAQEGRKRGGKGSGGV